jgi:O-antigen/teichoic acid export membrane protein
MENILPKFVDPNQSDYDDSSPDNPHPSIKKNFFFSSLLNFTSTIFPIVTFAFIARILGPLYVGKVVFALAFVGYFIILGNLGLPVYGVREIAKIRNSKKELEKKFSQLFILNFISLFFFSILYIISMSFLESQELTLYTIVGFSLLLNMIQVQWFYQGIENYKFITFSTISFQVIAFLVIFLFINNPQDYLFYALALVLYLYGSSILNFLFCFRYSKLNLKYGISIDTLKHSIALFSVTIIANIYFNLDKFLLGFLENDIYLGYYSPTIQVIRIIVILITSLGMVLTPRISYYIRHNQLADFAIVSRYSLLFVFWFGFPSIIGVFVYAKEIILIFAGDKFLEAVPALQILTPIILFLGLTNFFGFQILVPHNKDRALFFAMISALFVSLISNLSLVPIYKHIGTAFSTFLTEFSVFLITAIFGLKYISIKPIFFPVLRYIIGSIGILIIIIFVKTVISGIFLSIIVGIGFSVVFYVLFLLVTKDPLTLEGKSMLFQLLRKYFVIIQQRNKN